MKNVPRNRENRETDSIGKVERMERIVFLNICDAGDILITDPKS